MSIKSEGKKAIKAEKQAQEKVEVKVTAVKFKGFDLEHDEGCKCNLETIDTIEDLLIEFGFVEVPCRFSEESKVESHTVYVPENFETTCRHCRVQVWTAYINFANGLFEAGLNDNFNQAYACIREYVEKGPNGKSYFHPQFEETPFGSEDESSTGTTEPPQAEARPAA